VHSPGRATPKPYQLAGAIGEGSNARIDATLPLVDLLAHRSRRASSRRNRSGLKSRRPDSPSYHLYGSRAAQPAAGACLGQARRRLRRSRGDARMERFPSSRTLLWRLRHGRGLPHGESSAVGGRHGLHHERRAGLHPLRRPFLRHAAHRDCAGRKLLRSCCGASDRCGGHERCQARPRHKPLLL
jgi:hypothetical protein